MSPTTNTTGRHFGFERDYNYHTAFRACYVVMHKIKQPRTKALSPFPPLSSRIEAREEKEREPGYEVEGLIPILF